MDSLSPTPSLERCENIAELCFVLNESSLEFCECNTILENYTSIPGQLCDLNFTGTARHILRDVS